MEEEEARMLEEEEDEEGGSEVEVNDVRSPLDLRSEVARLTLELQEANEEKLQAARYGLAVLEESAAVKSRNSQLEEEQEALKQELQQLREVSRWPREQRRKQPVLFSLFRSGMAGFNTVFVVPGLLSFILSYQRLDIVCAGEPRWLGAVSLSICVSHDF